MKTQISLLAFCLLLPQFAHAGAVEVTVSGADGVPVAGALVQVESFQLDDEDNRSITLHAATSDAAGVAKFDLQPAFAGDKNFGRAVAFKRGLALGGVELYRGKRAIRLVAPVTATGTVRDEKGAPIAGAKVQLQSMKPTPDSGGDWLFFYGAGAKAFAAAIETQTDEKGVWKLPILTPGAEFSVDIQEPGFAQKGAGAKLADGPIETTLKPEARVAGQLLKPEGTPLEGVEIAPYNQESEAYIRPLITDAQGRFVATGLSADQWGFSVDLKQRPYVVSDMVSLDLKVGDNVLPPIQLQNGVVVRGKVRDADGAPVGMRVMTNLPGQAMTKVTRTNKNGDFAMRVPAGERMFSLGPLDRAFRKTNEQKTLQIAPGDKPQIEWILERASIVRGVILDEAGAPIQAPFTFARDGDMNMSSANFKTDAKGHFETPVDIDGVARVLGQIGIDGRQYQIVGNTRILLPSKGEINLVAQLAKPVFFSARAVDSEGKPLANVEFEAAAIGDASYENVSLRSDANGDLKSDNLGKGAQLQGAVAARKGYQLSAPIEIVKDGDNWTAKPLVFARHDAELSGQILDSNGKPAVKARVFAGGIETQTDEQGVWALKNLPPGELLVSALAADGQTFVAARAPLQVPLQLQTVTFIARDKALAQSILDGLKMDAKGTGYSQRDRLRLAANEGFVAQIKVADAEPKSSPVRLFYELRNQTNVAAKGALESETTQAILDGWQAMTRRADRVMAASALMEARPNWKDAAGANDFVFRLEEDVNGELAGQDPQERKYRVEGVFALAAAFETQGQTESADRVFKNAVEWTFKIPDSDNNGELGREALLMRGVGAFGNAPRLFGKLLNYFEPDSYWHHHALGEVIVPTTRARGLSAALPYIEQLQGLPDSRSARVQGDEMPYAPASQMPRIITDTIIVGGKSDPALALKLAQSVKVSVNGGREETRSRALIEAAFWQTPDVAAVIWRAQLPQMKPAEAAKIAARIDRTDANLARELYTDARERLENEKPAQRSRLAYNDASDAEFAFAEAQFEPARARFRLEMAWPDALREETYRYPLRRYVLAMARLSPQRALEMAREIPDDKEFSSFDIRYALARALAGDGENVNW